MGQSNAENRIADGVQRGIKAAGLDDYFEEIIVPVEKVTECKAGKKRINKRKLYPGYIVVHMLINDDTWFVVRETPGIGDFLAGLKANLSPGSDSTNAVLFRYETHMACMEMGGHSTPVGDWTLRELEKHQPEVYARHLRKHPT